MQLLSTRRTMCFCREVSSTVAAVRSMGSIGSGRGSYTPPPAPSPSGPDPNIFHRSPEELRLMSRTYEESIYKLGKHRSNALELIHKIPVVEVDGDFAICDGGAGALGHPIEYISVERPGSVEYCKWCSLRYTKKKK